MDIYIEWTKKVSRRYSETFTHTLSYIRAASQVRVIDGVGEVEAQLNTLGSERTEDIVADGTCQRAQSTLQQQHKRINNRSFMLFSALWSEMQILQA